MFATKLVGSDLRKLGFWGGLEIRTLCKKGVGRVLETKKNENGDQVGAWKMYPVNRSVSILSEFNGETKRRDFEPRMYDLTILRCN